MSTRPEIIFPLFSALTVLDGVGPKIAKNFENLGITRPRDLLFTLPYSGIKRDLVSTVQGAELPNVLTVQVTVGAHKIRSLPCASRRSGNHVSIGVFPCPWRLFAKNVARWGYTNCVR